MNIKQLIIILIFFVFARAAIISPNNGDVLNYKDFNLEWTQIKDAIGYEINVRSNDIIIYSEIDYSLKKIIKSSEIKFDDNYSIIVTPLSNSGPINSLRDSVSISTSPLPLHFSIDLFGADLEVTIYDTTQMYYGYTMLPERIVDGYGETIWFWPDENRYFWNITHQLDNGNLIGVLRNGAWDQIGSSGQRGVHVDIHGEILFETDFNIQREFHSRSTINSNLTYLTFVKDYFINPLTGLEIYGDIITEVDDSGNIIWEWNVKDYFSYEDVDSNATSNDWTHCNAIFFDYEDSAMYLSCRHLSRITKISYPDGNIIWNMGRQFISDDINFGDELGLSWQHAIKKLENGNLMLFDNGNNDTPQLSRGLELSINEENDIYSAEIIFEYTLPESFFGYKWGDCDKLPNGNTVLTSGPAGAIFEVSPNGELVSTFLNSAGTYRSERIDGIHPLAYSILTPNFDNDNGLHTSYLPTGETITTFELWNDGDSQNTFMVNIGDELGWIQYNNSILLDINSNYSIDITTNVYDTSYDNVITIEVCPLTNSYSECSYTILNSRSCSTNPNYYFSDSSECPESLVGDINSDGLVNILDVVQLVNIVLLNQFESLADINSDDLVNILDIVQLVNIILL